jgi:hypothetical protein
MTEKQEIRAKSTELAIRLMGVAIGGASVDSSSRIPKYFTAEEAQQYFTAVVNLSRQFEAFILEPPGNT